MSIDDTHQLNPEGFVSKAEPREMTRIRRGRQIKCPACGVTFETMRRFEMACPECGYEWEEPSHRTIIDSLRELPGMIAFGVFVACGSVMILWVVAMVVVASGLFIYAGLTHGSLGLVAFGLFLPALLASIVVYSWAISRGQER
jgi:DNA-directed RNA polymerase subunit RPC12/RpoP